MWNSVNNLMMHTLCLFSQFAMWEILINQNTSFILKGGCYICTYITHALFTDASFEISMLLLRVLSFPDFLDSLWDGNFGR